VEREGVEAPAPGAADNVGDGQLRTVPADQIGDRVGTVVGGSSRTHHVKAPFAPRRRANRSRSRTCTPALHDNSSAQTRGCATLRRRSARSAPSGASGRPRTPFPYA